MTEPTPGDPIAFEDINATPDVVPMFPPLANLIKSAQARLVLYSLWALWMLVFLVGLVPALDEIPKALVSVNAVGSILFGGLAASNVPRSVKRASRP